VLACAGDRVVVENSKNNKQLKLKYGRSNPITLISTSATTLISMSATVQIGTSVVVLIISIILQL
jgi:hypothetical protein